MSADSIWEVLRHFNVTMRKHLLLFPPKWQLFTGDEWRWNDTTLFLHGLAANCWFCVSEWLYGTQLVFNECFSDPRGGLWMVSLSDSLFSSLLYLASHWFSNHKETTGTSAPVCCWVLKSKVSAQQTQCWYTPPTSHPPPPSSTTAGCTFYALSLD